MATLTRDESRGVGVVADKVMIAPVYTVREDETVRMAASRMLEHGLGALPVVNVSGEPIGMVSDGDLLGRRQRDPRREWWLDLLARGAERPEPPRLVADRPVREVMTAPLIAAAPGSLAQELVALMRRHEVKRIPMVADGKLVGIVSRTDLLRLFETIATPLADPARPNALLDFLESIIGGASLRGVRARSPGIVSAPAPAPVAHLALSATTLREEVRAYGEEKTARASAERDAARLKRQRDVKALLQAHIEDASWREMLAHADAAAKNGETEMLMLAFPCALCSDGGRMIDVAEGGWEATLRGEAAEVYARWRDELQPLGFGVQARIVGWDEQGAIAEAGLFLGWG